MIVPTPDELRTEEIPQIIPEVWTSKDVLRRAHQFVQQQLEKALPDHKARESKWLLWDEIYNLVDKTRPDDGANIVDPEPQMQVEVMVANYLEAFFAQDPNFEYAGTEDSDQEQAEIMTAYRADHLRRIELREKMERTLRQWCVYGTAICKDPYRKEVKQRVVRERVVVKDAAGNPKLKADGTPKTKMVEEKKDIFIWDDTDWEYVEIFDFIPVGKGPRIADLEGCIHRVKADWDHVSSNERKEVEVGGTKMIKGVYYNLDELVVNTHEKFDLLEYYGKIPKWVVTGEESDRKYTFEGLITTHIDIDTTWEQMQAVSRSTNTGEIASLEKPNVISTDAAIRCQENGFWHQERPFRSAPHTPVGNEFHGRGMIEPIVDKWHELNTTIRQILDNKTLQLLNPTIEDVTADVQRDVKLTRFPRIKARDVNAVQPLRINDFSANGWRVIASIKDDMRRLSGVTETIQGVPMQQDRTSATEFQGVAQQAGVRLKNKMRLFDENMFKKFLERSYINDQQFKSTERIVRVVGKKGVKFKRVRPEDIYGTLDITTFGPTRFENQVIKTQKLTNFFAIAARAPQFFNIPKLGKKLYVSMDIGPEHEAEEIVISSDPESRSDIQEEISALSLGQPVKAKASQDHALHVREKMAATQQLMASGLMDDQAFKAFEDNVNEHLDYIKIAESQAMAQQGQLGQVGQNGAEVPMKSGAPDPTQAVRF